MVVLTIFNTQILKGSEALPFRHDISTIVTVKEPLSPELAKHLKQKFKNFVDWYAVAVNQCKGAYKVKITPDLGIPEWESFNSLYLFVNETNDVRLIVERDRKFYIAPLSKPGLMTDRTLFLGPKNAGIHFLYQALKNELHTIVSPFSLQKHVSFKRINPITLSFYNDLKNLQEAPMPQDVNTSSVTNFMYYVEKTTGDDKKTFLKQHDDKMKKLYGTYVFDDKSFFEKSIELNVDKWYLVINSSNEVFAVEEVRGALYFRLESRPGKVDEKFLDFGGYSGFSYIYMLNKNGISVLFNWALSFDDDINRLEENYLERKKNNTFQRILKFKRTDPIPPERFPVRSRSPGEAFFDFKQKKDDSK